MGSSTAFSAHKIYIDSCEIRPAMQRGQRKSSAHGPSVMQSFCICFLPPCLSQSCHLPTPILKWLVSPSAFCSSCRCPVQLGHSQVPAARWRTLLPYHRPSGCNTRLKVRRELNSNRQTLPEKLHSTYQNKSGYVLSACVPKRGKEPVPGENDGKNLLPLSSKADFMFKSVLC